MLKSAEVRPEEEPVAAFADRLSGSHLREIIYLKDDLQRLFYAELCRREAWSVCTLRGRIQGMFERTAISRKPDELIKQELENLRSHDRVQCVRPTG